MFLKKYRQKINPTPPTREELYVKDFLDGINLKYIREYRLDDLRFDTKTYRMVDFYLPRLGVCVEYFGMYNATKSCREEYDNKVKVYIKNNIPTIVLYPHELGFLEYSFHKKMLTLLRMPKFKKRTKIFRYKTNRYLTFGRGYYFVISIVLLFLAGTASFESKTQYDFFYNMFILFFAFSVLFLVYFFYWLVAIFFYDY